MATTQVTTTPLMRCIDVCIRIFTDNDLEGGKVGDRRGGIEAGSEPSKTRSEAAGDGERY